MFTPLMENSFAYSYIIIKEPHRLASGHIRTRACLHADLVARPAGN
jgi:hypothetical protein